MVRPTGPRRLTPARTREPPLSSPRRPGHQADRPDPRHNAPRGGVPNQPTNPRPGPRPGPPPGARPDGQTRPLRGPQGGPRPGAESGVRQGGRPGPGDRRVAQGGPRRPAPSRRKAGKGRLRSATAVGAAVAASVLAIGTGVALDRLVLPELRSEPASAAGPDSRPVGLDPTGPDADPTAGNGTDGGTPTGGKPGTRPRGVTATSVTEAPTPPLKTMRAPAKPTPTPSPSTSAPSGGGDAPAPTTPGGGGGGMSAAEAAVVSLTNAERAKEGCPALRSDARLTTAARRHSADMAANNYFDHTSKNGDSPWKRMEDAGYPSPGAENIAKGYPTAAAVVKGWMNSPGHRANILNCGLRAIGVGKADGPGGPLWTQNFGWK